MTNMRRKKLLGFAILAGVLVVGLTTAFAQGVLFVKDGNVGIGIDTPTNLLHVNGAAGDGLIFTLANTGAAPGFRFTNVSSGKTWFFRGNQFDTFTMSLEGTGGEEFRLRADGNLTIGPGGTSAFNLTPTGDLTIAGTLTQGSSSSIKKDFIPVEGKAVLEQVAQLPVTEWTYKTDQEGTRHLGPMAEDFNSVFGLGEDQEHLAPADVAGVALAAVKGLNEVVVEKNERIAALERQLAELQAQVSELANSRE